MSRLKGPAVLTGDGDANCRRNHCDEGGMRVVRTASEKRHHLLQNVGHSKLAVALIGNVGGL